VIWLPRIVGLLNALGWAAVAALSMLGVRG
jgi:hypothetical protein